MQTREKKVVVKILKDGVLEERSYPINDKGELMTTRLWRLVNGGYGQSETDIGCNIEFVGLAWEKPYTLFYELLAERLGLQRELLKLGDRSRLPLAKPRKVPRKASDDVVTKMIKTELELRRKMKKRINALRATTN